MPLASGLLNSGDVPTKGAAVIATYPPPMKPLSSDPEVESPVVCKRRVNDAIHASLGSEPEPIGFLCECTRADCFRVVWLSVDEFRDARTEPRWAVLAASHDYALRAGRVQGRGREVSVT
jgi:hypothetical protein